MARHGDRPTIDERVDAILTERMSPAQHRRWWDAEGEKLGLVTPSEALWAGEREAVIEPALGRTDADLSVPLSTDARAAEIVTRIEQALRRRWVDAGGQVLVAQRDTLATARVAAPDYVMDAPDPEPRNRLRPPLRRWASSATLPGVSEPEARCRADRSSGSIRLAQFAREQPPRARRR